VLEVFYGLFTACDVAYFTYTYSKVDKSHYQEVTGHTRAAYLVGRAISGIVSQILISSQVFSYYYLNVFTLGGLFFSMPFYN
jgi:thiamine transporter 2/3